MTKNWDIFPKVQPYGEDLANFSCYRLYEKSAIAGYGVLSGCVVSRSSASAVVVSSGTITVAGVKKPLLEVVLQVYLLPQRVSTAMTLFT